MTLMAKRHWMVDRNGRRELACHREPRACTLHLPSAQRRPVGDACAGCERALELVGGLFAVAMADPEHWVQACPSCGHVEGQRYVCDPCDEYSVPLARLASKPVRFSLALRPPRGRPQWK